MYNQLENNNRLENDKMQLTYTKETVQYLKYCHDSFVRAEKDCVKRLRNKYQNEEIREGLTKEAYKKEFGGLLTYEDIEFLVMVEQKQYNLRDVITKIGNGIKVTLTEEEHEELVKL